MGKTLILVLFFFAVAIIGSIYYFQVVGSGIRNPLSINSLSESNTPRILANIQKGSFSRFEGNYIVYKKDNLETKMLLDDALILIQKGGEISRSDFTANDEIIIHTAQNSLGEKTAKVITRYPKSNLKN